MKMEHFYGEKNKHYITVSIDENIYEALREANKIFKSKVKDLKNCHGWVLKDEMFLEKVPGGKEVWVIFK